MSYLEKIVKQAKEKSFNKIIKKRMLNKSIYASEYLYINEMKYPLKIIKLSNFNDICTYLTNNDFENYDIGYMLPLVLKIDLPHLKSNIDIVVVDLSWNVVDLYHDVDANNLKLKLNETSYVYLLHKNAINIIDIKIDDNVRLF